MKITIRESLKVGALCIYCGDCDWYLGKATKFLIRESEERLCHSCCRLEEHNHNTVWASL